MIAEVEAPMLEPEGENPSSWNLIKWMSLFQIPEASTRYVDKLHLIQNSRPTSAITMECLIHRMTPKIYSKFHIRTKLVTSFAEHQQPVCYRAPTKHVGYGQVALEL